MSPVLLFLLRQETVQRAVLWSGVYLLVDLLFLVSLACWIRGAFRAGRGKAGAAGIGAPKRAGPWSARASAALMILLFTAVPVRAAVIGWGLDGGLFPALARIPRLLHAPLPVVAAAPPLTTVCAVMSVRSWLTGFWSAPWRIHYSLITAGGAVCTFLLLWWNLC